ncbi:MAG: transglycosylase SLT domain-containing protein [Deltaproteobacteria bacterium]|nr:transglycosylase SLT domain-containing protein [Deltaproteobacteria bacterium]MBT7712075.1 transglycosylase SLT domain-containing protein [Deltaproteobacteria bacterium]MBT7888086.1 transglycosylase SLT domain-containing protein [Deltaproteobacteria bacterium]
MSPRISHYIYLLLIIGALAVSGNVSGEVKTDSRETPSPYLHSDRVAQSENESFRLSSNDLLSTNPPRESVAVVPEAIVAAPLSETPSMASPPPEGIYFLIASSESESIQDVEDDQADSALFFMNIEKMMTVSSDPVLNSLEAVLAEGVEDDADEEEIPNLVAMETAVSTFPLLVPNIPLYRNKKINAFINMYTRRKRAIFKQAINRSGKYMKMIHRIFREYELPYNLAYLAVVESNFNPFARSRANAVGMWQFMSYTGKVFDLQRSWWHDDRFDPEKSTVAAAKYLKRLHRMFKGDWELALAAYNSGSGTVRRAIRRAKRQGKPTDFWSLKLPRETRGYVPAFYAVVTIFNDLDSYGFTERTILLDEVSKQPLEVAGGISLKQIAKALSVEYEVLSELNPSLRLRGLVPPVSNRYEISIPGEIELSAVHLKKLAKLSQDRLSNWKSHTVRQGETLWSISRHYRIPVKRILAFNRFKRKNLINIGQKLMLPVASNWVSPVIPSKTKLAKRALDKLPGVTHVHKVQKGDTLWKISNKYNIPIKTIKYWNRKALRRRVLKIGTEIVLKLPVDYVASST